MVTCSTLPSSGAPSPKSDWPSHRKTPQEPASTDSTGRRSRATIGLLPGDWLKPQGGRGVHDCECILDASAICRSESEFCRNGSRPPLWRSPGTPASAAHCCCYGIRAHAAAVSGALEATTCSLQWPFARRPDKSAPPLPQGASAHNWTAPRCAVVADYSYCAMTLAWARPIKPTSSSPLPAPMPS